MKFLVCGTLVPTRFETKIEQLSNAGNRFLMNFCRNLSRKNELSVLSFVSVEVSEKTQQEIKQEQMGFEIRYYFSFGNRVKSILKYMKMMKMGLQETDYVVTYNTAYAWLSAPYLAKRKSKKSLLILADYSPADSYESFLRKLYARFQLKAIQKYDCVIGLSRNTERYLRKNQKFLCMEGGIEREFYDYYDNLFQRDDDKIRLMYAGILEPVTGIVQLVQAFEQMQDENVRLFISGRGSLKGFIEEAAEKDPRIIYLGCTSYPEYMENLKKADILINPRDMNLLENQYNFPSKIMEYLATGKRIISTKFPGWEKFSECITFCESNVKDIKEKVEQICSDGSRDQQAGHAERRQFAEQFIWERQIDRLEKNIDAGK